MSQKPTATQDSPSRRTFLKKSSAAVVGGTLAATLASPRMAHAAGDDTIKVALIGCGGRGTGAAMNASRADANVKITVLADAYPDRIGHTQNTLKTKIPTQIDISPDRCFSGLDAYKSVMMTDVDVVILATPPHFRPAQLAACIDANKHVFCEKPVAVDGPGVRSVLETTKKAREKDLSIVSGLCWRYDYGVRETMKRIQDGAIGDIVAIQENYLTGTLWYRDPQPDWSPLDLQLRNWLYYTWLSGDHIVEQHIHSLDKALWLMGDKAPAKCFGLGGRQVRTEEKWGNAYDHFAVCYEWDNGVKAHSYTRQMSRCMADVDDYIVGTKGRGLILGTKGRPRLITEAGEWKYKGDSPSMYDVEHKELFAGIRAGKHINNGEYMSYSTLMAIMGREACYTGKEITSEMMLNSKVSLGPKNLDKGDVEVPEVAVPGLTKFA